MAAAVKRSAILVFVAAGAAGGCAIALGSACSSFRADTTTPDEAGEASMPPAIDAASDAASDAPAVDDDAGPPCADSTTILLGTSTVTGTGRASDFILAHARDAHYFVAAKDGTARCAWLYVVQPPSSGSVYFGVYRDRTSEPTSLIARAKLAGPLTMGWNRAPLEGAGLPIKSGTPMWIAVGPDEDTVVVNSKADPNCNPQSFTGMYPSSVTLADPFMSATRFQNCIIAAYLGR